MINFFEENMICPVCKNNNNSEFKVTDSYKLLKCHNCGLVWDAYPPMIKKQFEEDYFVSKDIKDGYTNYIEGMKVNRLTFKERLKKIKKKTGKTGKLLDVGCALGDCLMEAKNLGWNKIYGIDPSSYSYKISQRKGIDIKKGTLRNVDFESNFFDIILYQDVIEHINDPLEELKIIYRILKPRGWLFIITPDINGWWAKILKSHWYHFRPNDHLVYFSKKSIIKALKTVNFVNQKVEKTYHIMSLSYIFTRLRFYSPSLFKTFLKITRKVRLNDLPIKMYTGEMEVWTQKPKN